MHKQHVVIFLVLPKKGTTVRRRLLLQVATLVKERASQRCPEWQIALVVVVAAGAGMCCGVYFAEGNGGGELTCAPTLWQRSTEHVSTPGFEPGLSRPRRDVLTTR